MKQICQHGRRGSRLLCALFVFTALYAGFAWPTPVVHAADPPTQPLDLIFEATGEKLDVVQEGAGTFGLSEAALNLDVPGSAVRKAYLIWAGLGRDDTVLLSRDDGAPAIIMADMRWNNDFFGFDTWGCCGGELSVYAADITQQAIVQNGQHRYQVSDMSVTTGALAENWGYSLIAVYEDPTLESVNDVVVKLGNDGLHFRWDGNLGPNSDVQCVAFPQAQTPRTMNFTVVVGGIKDIYRPNGLWGMTGNQDYVDLDRARGTWRNQRGLIDGVSGITGVGGAVEIDGPLDGDFTDNGVDWPFTDNRNDQWDLYPVFRVRLDPTDTWACVQIESANRPEIVPGPGTDNLGASIGFLGLLAVFESDAQPAIDIEKYTNGEDADKPTGPVLSVGDPVTWTYAVTNIGTVTLTNVTVDDDRIGSISCPLTVLGPGESMECQAMGTAQAGLYVNVAVVEGESPSGVTVTDEDPSHYFAAAPAIDIEKYTNGEDADSAEDAVQIRPGDPVTWTYVVTNIGDVLLTNVAVVDNRGVVVTCPKTTLEPAERMTCVGQGTAAVGLYANVGTVTGEAPNGTTVTDLDPSHYTNSATGFESTEPMARNRLFVPLLTP